MIAIVNVEAHDTDPEGWRTYEVRINRKVICTFRHKRSDGLAACLQKAGWAVVTKEAIQALKEPESMSKEECHRIASMIGKNVKS